MLLLEGVVLGLCFGLENAVDRFLFFVGVVFGDLSKVDVRPFNFGALSFPDLDSSLASFLFTDPPFCFGVDAFPFFGVDFNCDALLDLFDNALGVDFDVSDGSLGVFLIGPVDLGLLLLLGSCFFLGD